MEPNIKITKKFTKKFGSKVTNRQYMYSQKDWASVFTLSQEKILTLNSKHEFQMQQMDIK